MGRILIWLGLALVVAGVFWTFGERWGLGRLPGDISIQRDNVSFHFPLMTSIIVSVLLSFILWVLGRFWR